MDEFQNLITELKRGSLTLAVLGSLHESYYGYSLLQSLQENGIEIEANTLYPLLRRLDTQGLLDSTWDTTQSRPRKYYNLSEKGFRVYKELMIEWQKIQISVENICREVEHNERTN